MNRKRIYLKLLLVGSLSVLPTCVLAKAASDFQEAREDAAHRQEYLKRSRATYASEDDAGPVGDSDPHFGDVGADSESPTSRECISASICVSAFGGYALDFQDPPDTVVWANPEEDPLPDGVQFRYGQSTTIWGKGRILWQEGDWVEISANGSYTGLGVQVYGDKTIGWARVLFDGLEVWRGNTTTVWSDGVAYAVYVEVDGFAPGVHNLTMEALGLDGGGGGKSVPVSYFGLR